MCVTMLDHCKRMNKPNPVLFGIVLFIAAAATCGCRGGEAPSLLEKAAPAPPHIWHAGSGSSESIFALPAADHGFTGSWGGYIKVIPADQQFTHDPVVPTSYYFGERDGMVYLRTEIYGKARWPVMKSEVKLLDAHRVRLQVDSLCDTCRPPTREVEVTVLKLTGPKTLDEHVIAYSYRQGDGHQQVEYRGVLQPLDQSQLAAIDRAVEHNHVFLGRINTSRPGPN
jgi:hypothetical protein